MSKKTAFNLYEIAAWNENGTVSLPTIQRGFVWKPYQIEDLWDSLLRGYPVGSFVLSTAENGRWDILDGQQRATAISLGMGKSTFRSSENYYRIFIDLQPPDVEDGRRFVLRVITRSQPWGYGRKDNRKTLPAQSIRSAMELYNVADPLDASLDEFFPFDAGLPVPLCFFVDAVEVGNIRAPELYRAIQQKYRHWKTVEGKWKEDLQKSGTTPIDGYDQLLIGKIEVILSAVKEMLDPAKPTTIPALYLDLEKTMENSPDDSPTDELENLFIRLNAGGTPLSGEELNYSILKANITREVQDKIEDACKQLFRPARFVTVAFRLYQQVGRRKKTSQPDSLAMNIKAKQFQKTISEKQEKFGRFLLAIVTEKKYDGKTLLEYAEAVLKYDGEKTDYGLPYLIYSRISQVSPELMFLLLYRIWRGDRFPANTRFEKDNHRKMLGMLTLFLWLGKGKNLRNHSTLLTNIWLAAVHLDRERFWSGETITRARIDDVLLPAPNFAQLRKISSTRLRNKANSIESVAKFLNEQSRSAFYEMIYNKELLLYAQTSFIESYFKQKQFGLEDSSMPFDWDHLFPQNLIRKKRGIAAPLKDWYQTIGNLRAWPYALNRMDSDAEPAIKLAPISQMEEDHNLKVKWQHFIDTNPELISNLDQLSKNLTEWSVCDSEWLQTNQTSRSDSWRLKVKLIIERNIKIIEHWYKNLFIEKLLSETQNQQRESLSEMIFDMRRWDKLKITDIGWEDFYLDDDDNWISKQFAVGQSELRFYFLCSNKINGHLKNDGIEFGFFADDDSDEWISRLLKKVKSEFVVDRYILNNFTLISDNPMSYLSLLKDILAWLNSLPVSDSEKADFCNALNGMLTARFRVE